MNIDTSVREAADAALDRVAVGVQTPAYVYDLGTLRVRVVELLEALDGFSSRLFFATMANDNPEVLARLADLGVGACVNSLQHLDRAITAGFDVDRIQFTSTGLPKSTLERLHTLGIACNLDSLRQIQLWGSIAPTSAGLRINAASLGRGRPFDRMGVDAQTVDEMQHRAVDAGVTINGLHVYVGTNMQRPEDILPTIDAFFDLSARIKSLTYLNIGGGIGVNYAHDGEEFDVFAYGRGLKACSERINDRFGRAIQVIVEPGRGLVANCGSLLTRVTDKKALGNMHYLGVDASIAIFPRPFHHPETPHRIRKPGTSVGAGIPSLIAGSTTFSRDILGEAVLPADIEIGDVLIFEDAGAYSESMMSRFLGQNPPAIQYIG